ncbi:transglutaminase family protein [Phormidium sp. CLA17]|uniref:transglutaminase family protein n=1 Tax=Leptolyngbya sp. Cla-17 TaxID=2803751 RepID=UPI001491A2CC|nr:transglutaminase family protein [Leptolyngbya sp. Cla-17]MBM0742938.1 transglutaminase family protein [Leptolyngbya sp. Cla-17]
MRYQIEHTTDYIYQQAVTLQPHVVRLRPRSDGSQILHSFSITVVPQPKQQAQLVDLDGNSLVQLWFDSSPTESLVIRTVSDVETSRLNPFDYFLEPWAVSLPADYPASLLVQLQPYLLGQQPGYTSSIDPIAAQLAQDLWLQANGEPLTFLSLLNQHIYQDCQYTLRETGDPLPAGVTWKERSGSCRDFAVLFVEVCRAIGLAARFVSGYQEGDLDNPERHLHAWAEVYLPGGGWRGYDPTQGLAVADRHIALVASNSSRYAAPVAGSFTPSGVRSSMTYKLAIRPLP